MKFCCMCKKIFYPPKTNKNKKTCSLTCARKLQRKTLGKAPSQTHGFARPGRIERLHGIWRGMLKRCYSKTHPSYAGYGARGITVCNEWINNYVAFREWFYSQDNCDDKTKATVDRINNNGPYSPSNCKLSSPKEQARNRRTSRNITYNGETKTVAEWSELLNIPYARLFARLCVLEWPIEKAMELKKCCRHLKR